MACSGHRSMTHVTTLLVLELQADLKGKYWGAAGCSDHWTHLLLPWMINTLISAIHTCGQQSCLSFQHRAYRLPLRIKTTKKKKKKNPNCDTSQNKNNNKGSGDCKTRNQCVVYSKLLLFKLEMVIYQAPVLPYPVRFFIFCISGH